MKKIITILFVASLVIASFVAIYAATGEKNYNKIFMWRVADRLTKDSGTPEDEAILLRAFVHENVHPVPGEHNRLDTIGIEKLTSGIGWCDQVSRVFMQLARSQSISTRLLFLLNEDGSSPHSIAEAWVGKKWATMDAAYDIDFRTKVGEMASMPDMMRDHSIVTKNAKVMEFAKYNSWWKDEKNLSMYYREPEYINTKKGSNLKAVGRIPDFLKTFVLNILQEAYMIRNARNHPNDYLYFKARNYCLSGNLKRCEYFYKKALVKNAGTTIGDKTKFFFALYLKDVSRYDEAIEVLTALINNPSNKGWLPYAYGLRSRVYELSGDGKKAQNDFLKYNSCPDAYL